MTWIQIVLVVFLLPWILQTIAFRSDMDSCYQKGRFYCNASMQCISKYDVCDGYNHCVNREDESPPACGMDDCRRHGYIFCDVSMQCIMKFRVCNGDNDCVDGEDESSTACALIRWCVSAMSLGEGCLGECKPGYFGKYCEKTCSNECFNGSCNSSSGICKDCTPGYFGKYCQPCSEKCVDRLCYSSNGICKNCTSGYFGKNCEKTCSKECTNGICNRSNGVCKDCTSGYFGNNCEKTCSKECTNGICNRSSGICKICTPGYFGTYCEKTCSKECTNGICNRSSGICKDCIRTYIENCSLQCSEGCREKDGFPQCDRQSGKCLNGCFFLNQYGDYCNVSCMNCKKNSSVVLCDNNGVCLYGCENGYWDKECNSKCSTNCEGDAYGNRCNSSTGECTNGCTRGWSGIFCEELTDNSITTTLIVIAAMFTVVVGIFCFVWARKRFIRQQNEHMEPGQVLPVDLQPRQQHSGSRRRQSSSVYADINEDTMEEYHNICEQNTPDHYDEINITIYDRDIRVVPSKEFTDDSNSVQSLTESKDELGSIDESISRRSVTHSYSDLDHACNTDNLNGVSVVELYSGIELPAASDSAKGGEIFGDLGQFQVDYIHAIASEQCDKEIDQQTIESSI